MSYAALRDLAVLAGVPAEQAWLWPLIVDGVIPRPPSAWWLRAVVATPARRYAWVLLVAGAAVSVAANITHAVGRRRCPRSYPGRGPGGLGPAAGTGRDDASDRGTHPQRQPTPRLQHRTAPGTRARPRASCCYFAVRAAHHGPHPHPERGRQTTARGRRIRLCRGVRRVSGGVLRRRGWRLRRCRLRQIARHFGVHPTTVSRWLDAPEKSTHASDLPVGASMKEDDDEHDAWDFGRDDDLGPVDSGHTAVEVAAVEAPDDERSRLLPIRIPPSPRRPTMRRGRGMSMMVKRL